MALKGEIKSKVKAILDEKFEVEEVSYVPKIDDPRLTFGNTGLKFAASVLSIDLRDSTNVLNKYDRATVGKLHSAFFHTIVKIANSHNGNVRSFNGDSALVFFQGNDKMKIISTAVLCAMQIKHMIHHSEEGINVLLQKYAKLNFGIGVDHGNILCTKVGIGGEHNRDIFWIGNAVNKSTVLSNNSESPTHISISSHVYSNLMDWAKFGIIKKNSLGEDEEVDMWTRGIFRYNDKQEYYYFTSWHWVVE